LRSLSELQQRVVEGDEAALAQQLSVARAIASDLARRPIQSWQSARDLRALIKYVLSGGDPTVLERLIASEALPEAERALARGSIAYARGDRRQAAAQLDSVNHKLLYPSLAGHVALVKASILSHSAAARAIEFCRDALLLSPGTHIEEAALRLMISLATETGNVAIVERSHRRHLLRFPKSLYARSIDARVAGIIAANANSSAVQTDTMEGIAALLPRPRRRAFFARLAEAGLRAGKLKTSIVAARLALLPPHSPHASDAEATAKILAIEGAALILTSERKEGLRRLDEASAAQPSAEAASLIATARGVATMIQAPIMRSTNETAASALTTRPVVASRATESSDKLEQPNPAPSRYETLLSRGKAALAMVDQLIEPAAK
jgi:chemotaxis protein MotC